MLRVRGAPTAPLGPLHWGLIGSSWGLGRSRRLTRGSAGENPLGGSQGFCWVWNGTWAAFLSCGLLAERPSSLVPIGWEPPSHLWPPGTLPESPLCAAVTSLGGLFAQCHSPGTSEKGSEISGSAPLAPQGLAGSPRSVFRPPGKCRTHEPRQSQGRLPLRCSPFPRSFLVLLLRLPLTRAPPISDLPRDRPCFGQNVCFLLKSVC